ncbi:MAG: hypothetical protein IIA06_12205 [Proteobacteria bacterium]|nr:hypothetical protein [Pseudomonadota bacterium]
MLKIVFVLFFLNFFHTNLVYSNGIPVNSEDCKNCQLEQCVVCIDQENTRDRIILNEIRSDISELKKNFGQSNQTTSNDQTLWDKILTPPSFIIAGATLVIAVLAIFFVIVGFFGFRSLEKTKEKIDKDLSKTKSDLNEEIDKTRGKLEKQLEKGEKTDASLKNTQDELKTTTKETLIVTNMHLGYMYWSSLEILEGFKTNKMSKSDEQDDTKFKDIVDNYIAKAIFFTEQSVHTIDNTTDEYIDAGLSIEQKRNVNIVNAKINLAFFYAYANRENKKDRAFQFLNEASTLIASLSGYGIIAERYSPSWTLDILFVKRKFEEAEAQKNDLKNQIKDLADRHPRLKQIAQSYIDWSDG